MKGILVAALIASCALLQISCKNDGKPITDAPTTTETPSAPATTTASS